MVRAVKYWNSLPKERVDAPSLETCKVNVAADAPVLCKGVRPNDL